MASSPRTAYSTLRRAGLSVSIVNGRIVEGMGCWDDRNLISVDRLVQRRRFLWQIGIRSRDHVAGYINFWKKNLSETGALAFLVAVRSNSET
jgi:hypothetical protein